MQDSHKPMHITNRNPNRTPLTGQRLALLAIATLLIGISFSLRPIRVARASTITVTAGPDVDAANNDFRRIQNAINAAASGDTIMLSGAFDFTQPFAAAAWALGNDNTAATADDYEVLVPSAVNNVTITASSLGAATIQGPGDLAAVNLEGVFVFDGGPNQGWTISNIRFVDFDSSLAFFSGAGGVTAFNDTKIINNYIKIAQDLNSTVAPADVNQNIGIHFSFGSNQMISGNTIEFDGDGVSDSVGGNFSSQVGMQSNTSGGNVYDGLQITNNILRVLNAQSADPELILGIWDETHAHASNITISGNQFINLAGGNNPATNLQRGFRVTSHSSPTTMVTYQNNTVQGANIGFQWLAGSNFAGNQPVKLVSNTITNNATGVLVQSQGLADLSFNRIVGNSVAGTNNVDGTLRAENNWWGCNFGPGVGGAGCAGTANGVTGVTDSNPWLVLGLTAVPNTITVGGTSSLTADLTFNSDNVDTHLSGNIPDATPVAFAGNAFGTVAPPSSSTTLGKANSTYTGTAPGTGNVSTTVDAQTVTTPITVNTPPNIVSAGATILLEGCSPGNGVIDPGETVTISFCVQNTGGTDTSNLIGALQATGGVTDPSGNQSYGVVTAGGPPVCQSFTFTADGTCGGTVTASIQFQDGEQDDAMSLGAVTYIFSLGVQQSPGVFVCCTPAASCTISCPPNQFANTGPGATQCCAVVNYPAPTADADCGTVNCNPASGTCFPAGTTTVTCTTSPGRSCSFTVTVTDNTPPITMCPANLTAVTNQTACPSPACQVVNYPAAVATDNCPGVGVVCNPPAGSCFPVGVTTVNCTATDTSGNTATCSFTVTTFDVALQDDSKPSTILLWNSITGQYRFCCNGTIFTGVGTATRQGCVYTLQTPTANDRRILGRHDKAVHSGSGSLQSPPGQIRCTITDRNTLNDTLLPACQ